MHSIAASLRRPSEPLLIRTDSYHVHNQVGCRDIPLGPPAAFKFYVVFALRTTFRRILVNRSSAVKRLVLKISQGRARCRNREEKTPAPGKWPTGRREVFFLNM